MNRAKGRKVAKTKPATLVYDHGLSATLIATEIGGLQAANSRFLLR